MATTTVCNRKKKQSTHKLIMHSAKALFEKRGIGNVTIDDIAESAGICRSTFFTHFASMDDLFVELSNQEVADLLDASSNTDADPTIKVRGLLHRLIEDTVPYPRLVGNLMMTNIINNEKLGSYKGIVDYMRNAVHETEDVSGFTDDEKVAVLMGGYFGLILRKFILNESFDDADSMKQTIDKLVDLIIK